MNTDRPRPRSSTQHLGEQISEAPLLSWRSEERWTQALISLGINKPNSMHKSIYDPLTRTYLHRHGAHKITLKVDLPHLYYKHSRNSREAELLRLCDGIPTVPSVLEYSETKLAAALWMNRIDGSNLQDVLGQLSVTQSSIILFRLLRIIIAISWRGVAHNDIVPHNILIDRFHQPYLVDFDQAHHAGRVSALLRNILGVKMRRTPALYGHWLSLASRLTARLLPWRKQVHGMPIMAPDATPQQRALFQAWKLAQCSNANAPGKHLAYYSLVVDRIQFPGERPWEQRWEMLSGAADFSELRTLELGCNMGLLSTWLLKFGCASSSLGVDVDAKILESARLISDALSVNPSFELLDLDSPEPWESRFPSADFDIVFALNVLNWVEDKDRLLRFLGQFQRVVFEGHDSDAMEIKRFSDVGLRRHTVLGISERQRTVFVFSR